MTMAATGMGFVPLDRQLFALGVGEALARAVKQRWPHHTAKQLERTWGVDRTTAANIVKGHASERTITKAIQAEGWPLLAVLGEALTGLTYDQHLQSEIEEIERAKQRLETRRERMAEMVARTCEMDGGRSA